MRDCCMRAIAANSNVYTKESPGGGKSRRRDARLYGIHCSAVAETIVFLSLALLAGHLVGNGNRFIGMPLHPFWIVVLVMTLQYGAAEALMAAVLSSLFLLVGNLPEQALTESLYDYYLRVTWLPFLWIATALALGSIRSRQLSQKQALVEKVLQ